MTAQGRTFYIDASVQIDVARALALLRERIMYPGAPDCPITHPSTKDTVWLPIVGREGWPVIMRDKKIRYRAIERQRLKEHGVQAFCLTTAGQLNKWSTMEIIMRRWDDMERLAASEPGPYIYAVTLGAPPRRIDI